MKQYSAVEKIDIDNEALREALKQRTNELEHMRRELEVEGALEDVRAVALSMKKPEDMLNVCRVISDRLKDLGVADIRNVQTAIINEKIGQYLCYQYFPAYDQSIIEDTQYHKSPVEHEMVRRMLDTRDGHFIGSLNGEALQAFRSHRKEERQFPDPLLDETPEVGYSFLSIGEGGLGLSLYHSMKEEVLTLFKRFHKVFLLAYQRFRDIQYAEAQAKEAEIQLALERVRARSLAMHHSDELQDVVNVVAQQLYSIGIDINGGVFIAINDEIGEDIPLWAAAGMTDYVQKVLAPFLNKPFFINLRAALKKRNHLYIEECSREEKRQLFEHLFQYEPWKSTPAERKNELLSREGGLSRSIAVSYYTSIAITDHYGNKFSEKENEILIRFGKVFEQSYIRFLDLQKAEAQAREAQIEAALERVRSKSLAMHHTSEIQSVIHAVHDELLKLNISVVGGSFVVINKDVDSELHCWGAGGTADTSEEVYVPHFNMPFCINLIEGIKKGPGFFTEEFTQQEKLAYFTELFKKEPWSNLPNESKIEVLNAPGAYTRSVCVAKNTSIFIINQNGRTFSEEENAILRRFTNVFEQTYTRFLDLQKAEAQAREAQIETALERVRSRSMAMHKSEELKEVIRVVLQQFAYLNINAEHAGFYIDYKAQDDMHIWLADPNIEPFYAVLPYFDTPTWNSFVDAKANGKNFFTDLLDFETKNKFYESLFEIFVVPEDARNFYMQCKGLAVSTVLLDDVGLYIENFSAIPYTDEENKILMRIGKVFQQTYTRFRDLQKAETQAREAQIQASLERTRTQSMLMQHSNELNSVSRVFHEQLLHLGIDSEFSFVWLPDEAKQEHLFWATWVEDEAGVASVKNRAIIYPLDKNEHYTAACYRAWESDQAVHVVFVPPDEIEPFFGAWEELLRGAEKLKPEFFPDGIYYAEAYMKYGCFGIDIRRPLSEEEQNILYRFSIEFERTYTRFLDLKRAEAQAREADIELALERVRARAMAMQKSDELKEAATILYKELSSLRIGSLFNCGYVLVDEENNLQHAWMTHHDGRIRELHEMPLTGDRIMNERYKKWKHKTRLVTQRVEGKELKTHLAFVSRNSGLNNAADQVSPQLPDPVFFYCGNFSDGYLHVLSSEALDSDAELILSRFTTVFEQTYTRFLDLKKAEAQAREAQIEAALEKVRSRTLAMQKSDELAGTAAVLFQQLIALGIAPNRLYIIILKIDSPDMEAWVTDEDGSKVSMGFTGSYLRNETFHKMYNGWQERRKSLVIDMQGDELQQYFHYLHDELKVPFKGGLEQKRRIQHIAYFSHGLIGMASPDEQPVETLQLMERFAAVFNLTFTRFNDLKIAEAHALQAEMDLIAIKEAKQKAEEALTDLKATQKQLIQSEKMASLGELTAGIAHEIQNPLNFVNNFSEVSKELIEELKSERSKVKDERDEALEEELLNDIAKNLEKINHHGKRADAIVKGMLQHSRSSTGQKEPTDINTLADEYLRLAYHGLKARDKSFDASFHFEPDNTLPKINVVPQDIGRVLLNLINNAFQAVNERVKGETADVKEGTDSLSRFTSHFSPLVSVSTKKLGDRIEISVKDNGPGIPEAIKDKIFQPFFTTKPTGQGTGLGLSLSYDIIKAHGGTLKLVTREGEGTTFIIQFPTV